MHPISLLFISVLIGYFIWYNWNKMQNSGGINSALLKAARGDRALARRMMAQAALKYPDKSEAWRREKIIYDLRR